MGRFDFLYKMDLQHWAGRYYVAISPDGGIAYDSPTIDVRNRGVQGIIHVPTKNISDDYPEYLREHGISYIFCGKETFNPILMMEKLYSQFGIKKAIISGGVYADCTLLSHGLTDEIKVMLVPVVDGGTIYVAAMNTAAPGPTKLAVEAYAKQAGKQVKVETIFLEKAKNCLEETGSTELTDQYVERWLWANQHKYSAYILPQVPLTRLMPRLRDMDTPVFDSMEPFVDELAKQ